MNNYPIVSPPLLSVIVCIFNESDSIAPLFDRLLPILQNIADGNFEVVCVDDGSQDDSLHKLVEISQRDSRIRIIELSRNFGKEAALTAGLEYATGQTVVPIDADLQDPPELIAEMFSAWRNGAEVVLARRINRNSDSLAKRKSASWFYRLYNRVSPTPLPENVGDFRLLDQTVVAALKRLPERQRFMKGIFAWVGFRTVTIDYVREQRVAGESKFSGWRLWNFALEGITSFTTLPLRMWTYIGLLGAGCSTIYASFIVLRTLIYGTDVPGYASLLVAVLFMGSMQLISIGLIGEYIGRLYIETKQRPIFLVRTLIGFDR